jgi:hypothetical protein
MIKETVPNRRLLLLITCLGVFMAALDGTMVIISLPLTFTVLWPRSPGS